MCLSIPSDGDEWYLTVSGVLGPQSISDIEGLFVTMENEQTSTGSVAAWGRATRHMANSIREANLATMAAFGLFEDHRHVEGPLSIAYEDEEWTLERSVKNPENIAVDDTVCFEKTIDDNDVHAFADATGDTNRLHLDDEFAEQTRFGGRIVHGTLVSGLISAALARLPGQTIYLSQDLQFVKSVEIGETLTAIVEVQEILGDDRFRLSTNVYDDQDDAVIEGEAVVLIDDLPPKEDSNL